MNSHPCNLNFSSTRPGKRVLRFARAIRPAAIRLALVAWMSLGGVAVARADVSLQILDADPVSPAVLGRYANFSLRIGYTCDRPIYVRAQPFYGDERVSAMTGGSPLYDAGSGEAFFWLAANNAAKVDAIIVTASGPDGKEIAQITYPVELSWTAERNENPPPSPEWVERMRVNQNSAIAAKAAAASHGPTEWLMVLLGSALMLCVPAYFILQIILVWRLRDRWRKAAAAPLGPMALVVLYTIYAYHDGSNLFPIVLIFVSPLALGYLMVVTIRYRISGRNA
jgi:hypothetical protein